MGIRNALRQATSLKHHALETHPLIATLLDPHIVLADVICIEQAFAAYHAAAAERLSLWMQDIDYQPFSHAAVLNSDLHCLGSTAHRTLHPTVPAFTSVADAVGYLYVAEGSLLGNRLIARHLAATLPEYHQRGGQYYLDDAERITAHWSPFCALLERFSDHPASLDVITARAQHTFAGIDDCLGSVADAGRDLGHSRAHAP
jgi:heme oxygenase